MLFIYCLISESRKKQPRKCPQCSKSIIDLTRHLKNIHGLTNDEALSVSIFHRRRSNPNPSGRHCPMNECQGKAPYKCLDKHLRYQNHMSMEDDIYKSIIMTKSSKKATPSRESIAAERWSKKFYDYLLTIDGGSCNPEASYQHKMHLRQVLNGVNFWSIDELISDSGISKLQKWFEAYIEEHEASSAITLLSTLISFFKFLLTQRLSFFNFEKFDSLRNKLNKWKSSFKKKKMGQLKITVPLRNYILFICFTS